jgi:hypothetical protein
MMREKAVREGYGKRFLVTAHLEMPLARHTRDTVPAQRSIIVASARAQTTT